MFWRYQEWFNAFVVQFIIIIVLFIIGKLWKIKTFDLLMAIFLICPVAIFSVSPGVAGAIFLSDFMAILLLFKYKNMLWTKLTFIAFLLYILWPIFATLLASSPVNTLVVNYDLKALSIHFSRFILFFAFFTKIISRPLNNFEDLYKLFKIQAIGISLIFVFIFLSYMGFISLDAWNELKIIENDSSIGMGSMFLYRGGIGTYATISIPILYVVFVKEKNIYKILILVSILIIFASIILSGSRQGVLFSIISLLLAVIFFLDIKSVFKFIIVGGILVFFVLPRMSSTIIIDQEWATNRYSIFFNDETNLDEVLDERNTAIKVADESQKSLGPIFGNGLGSAIVTTESDYYNTYLYFGIIGLFIYIVFIVYTLVVLFKNWILINNIYKKILSLSLICSIVMPLYGFQQWYIMTFGSHNAVNAYYILFILGIGYNIVVNRKLTYLKINNFFND